jgi:dienelactone hydrolase
MKNTRRNFLKVSSLAGISLTQGNWRRASSYTDSLASLKPMSNTDITDQDLSIIGQYGPWITSQMQQKLPAFSFRKKEWKNLAEWKKAARAQVIQRMAIPDLGGMPTVKVNKAYTYDGLHIEELSWQLPYGRPTHAILLKPQNAQGRLPAILAFHDHAGNKYFGTQKITRTQDQNPLMAAHQKDYYSGLAWANEIARQGYVVLVPDAFAFASRRIMLQDVPARMRNELTDPEPSNADGIDKYNQWASDHEHILSKSLLSAGTTWPGVFFAEDRKALDILCARKDVDANKVGCGGLSGGGLRTVLMAGLDERIKCAVCVGFMTTWKDFILNKSFTHTWMSYIPLLPTELDFPEILSLRAPLPALVLNDSEDTLFTLPEMKQADQILTEVYTKANAAGHYKTSFHPGPHKFDAKMQAEAFEWFTKWLKS